MTDERTDIDRLRVGDRDLFIQMMKEMYDGRPTPERWKEFAGKYPDRYVYSMKLMAGMMGLSEKVEYTGTIHHAVWDMSDADLMKKVEEAKVDIAHPMKKVKDGKS